jgi:hypothetical protein
VWFFEFFKKSASRFSKIEKSMKLRFQYFWENFQNLRTSVFMSQKMKNPWFFIFKKFQRIDGSHERTTKELAV